MADYNSPAFCGASLLAAAAVGAGTPIHATGTRSYALDVRVTGAPTSFTVALEGTIDGANWTQLGTTSAAGMTWQVDKPVRYIRANLTALTGGTSPTVTATVLGA